MRFQLKNGTTKSLSVTVEPWAEEYVVPRDAVICIALDGGEQEVPLIEVGDKGIVVFAWPGSALSVTREGKELSGAGQIRVPDLP